MSRGGIQTGQHGRECRAPVRCRSGPGADSSPLLRPASPARPWQGRRNRAAWGSGEYFDFTCVAPEEVVEVAADSAVDDGRYRHPVRYVRRRPDLTTGQVPSCGAEES